MALRYICATCGRETIGARCTFCHGRVYGRGYRARRAPLIGQPCELRLPGCTGIADTADHVIRVVDGGADGPLRPGCASCNYRRRSREV